MRSSPRLVALVFLCALAAMVAPAEDPAPTPPPPPTPPRQNEPWTPPETRLPRFFVEAARTLFDQGFADPRGCEYRSIRIQINDVREGWPAVATTGWVLPNDNGDAEKDEDGPRFAVAWNGLVYPLVEVGEPADLDADIQLLGNWPAARVAPRRGSLLPNENEIASVSLEPLNSLQACLLLRLGRADLAEAIWTADGHPLADRPTGPGPSLDLRDYGVSYLSLARNFASLLYGRAVRAHLRGDDAMALADARALDAFWRAADAKAAEIGFIPEVQVFPRPAPKREGVSRYMLFLDQAPALLADQERRARERTNPPPPAPRGGKAAALIRDLDQLAAASQGAFINGAFVDQLDDSPTIQALVALGDDAVEPLIQALRSDDRLTRSRDFGGGVLPGHRLIMRVNQAAYIALTKILKVSTFSHPSLRDDNGQPVDRNALADQIQEYWDKNKGIP